MPLSERENYLRNATFRNPEWVPASIVISGASWDQCRGEMEDVLVRHPTLFPDFEPGHMDFDGYDYGPGRRAGETYTDAWGCVWHAAIDGIAGAVVQHPLADWSSLASYVPPDPLLDDEGALRSALWGRRPDNWQREATRLKQAIDEDRPARASVGHGILFLLLGDLRGFDNFMTDLAAADPRLQQLVAMASDFTTKQVVRLATFGPDVIEFGDDLGAQTASIPGPTHFERYLAPTYRAWFERCHRSGILTAFHSDGYILDLLNPLLQTGVDIINPQDLVNGIDDLAREAKGRVCIRLDIDRQSVLPYGSAAEIRELVEMETRLLGSPAGGLEFICGIYPPTPPENVDALCRALEESRRFWWE